jgi:hypothetical protein
VVSGVKMVTLSGQLILRNVANCFNSLALPLGRASMAVLYASGSVLPSLGNSSNETSRPLYASEMFFWRCSPGKHQ